MAIRKITIEDAEYPSNLKNIFDPPRALYVNGKILPQDDIAVALVGSRRASIYGLQACEKLAYELASFGVTVVSGMARGIDTAAHTGALKARGRTIAVLGSGHNEIYPRENKSLYEEIAQAGAVVTEFEDDVPPLKMNFPKRNRIISGLSLGVVVVEAAKRSGALITAALALDQGREVFAVPGKISSSMSLGTNELIRDGARLVQSAEDILDELKIKKRPLLGRGAKKAKPDLDREESRVFSVLSDEPLHLDEIIDKTGIPLTKASRALVSLELKRLAKALPGNNYIKGKEGL